MTPRPAPLKAPHGLSAGRFVLLCLGLAGMPSCTPSPGHGAATVPSARNGPPAAASSAGPRLQDAQVPPSPASSAANSCLGEVRSRLDCTVADKSSDDLFLMLITHPECGFRSFDNAEEYAKALALNKRIRAELVRRGAPSVALCQRHLHDLRNLFTGDGGPAENVATLCAGILRELGQPAPQHLPMQFCQ